MLERLDTIDWSSLTHAHGPATDVPKLLQALLSENVDRWMEACADLHETIWHQGTVYSASAAVVPFLFEVATARSVDDSDCSVSGSDCAVSLLCAIATGEGLIQYGLRVDGEQSLRARLARNGQLLEDAIEQEHATMDAIQQGVSAGLRQLLPWLHHPAADLRSHVAIALGVFPEHRTWLLPTIDASLASETDAHVRKTREESRTRLRHST